MEAPAVERLRWNRGEGLEVEESETEDALSPASKDPDLGLEESIPGGHAGGAGSEEKELAWQWGNRILEGSVQHGRD